MPKSEKDQIGKKMAEKMRNVFTSVSETVFPGSKALINKRKSPIESGEFFNFLIFDFLVYLFIVLWITLPICV